MLLAGAGGVVVRCQLLYQQHDICPTLGTGEPAEEDEALADQLLLRDRVSSAHTGHRIARQVSSIHPQVHPVVVIHSGGHH
jgi:hypothetical protein